MNTTRFLQTACLAVACLLTTACTVILEAPAHQAPSAPQTTTLAAAQRGHGANAAFALCPANACPRPTPKTLARAAPPRRTPQAQEQSQLQSSPSENGSTASPLHNVVHRPISDRGNDPLLVLEFASGSARLYASARAALQATLPQLAQASTLTLVGHTDSTGTAGANARLARARAAAVQRHLVALAPALASRVRVEHRSACCFVDSNDTPSGRARNRRVEILQTSDQQAPP